MPDKPTTLTIRVPEEMAKQLKDRFAETYPEHRMSFNAWLISRIQLSFTPDA